MEDKERKQTISSIDKLFRDVVSFTDSERFKQMLDFYKNFKYLGVYNAALVEMQRPGAVFVLTADNWKKQYKRVIKKEARPVVILLPFYPVEFLFDLSDTEQDPTCMVGYSDKEILEDLEYQYDECSHYELSKYMDNVKINLPRYGISLQNYIVGSEEQAKITFLSKEDRKLQDVYVNTKSKTKHLSYYNICVSSASDKATALASIFHELGHMFCRHLSPPTTNWWKPRTVSHKIKEFEAETVSYLVCERLGIKTSSVEYLATYFNENRHIPQINVDLVIRAVDEIEKIYREPRPIKECMLYKHDKEFKEIVDDIMKEKKSRQKNEPKNSGTEGIIRF